MEQESLTTPKPLQMVGLAALAIFTSAAVAIAVLYAVRSRQRSASGSAAQLEVETIPVQPGVNTSAPVDAPTHFSEDVIVPGFTETGTQVLEDDNALGRSPEGV